MTPTTGPMALCCWCLPMLLVLLYPAAYVDGLPITSKPLDNNPDHLTWEAAWLSEDSRAPQPLGGKAKKITPKSIFITPFLNNYNTSACPPDYKVDYNGKCIQTLNINQADILVMKLQSLFSPHGDGDGNGAGTSEDNYDYDYDSTGPFQVNLPLSIDLAPEPPQTTLSQAQVPKLTYQDNVGPSFYDSAMVNVATVEQDQAKITTVPVDGTTTTSEKPFLVGSQAGPAKEDQTLAESAHTDISFLAFETLPNGTVVGQVELEGSNSTVVQNIIVSSTTTPAVPVADSSTTEPPVTEQAGDASTTPDHAGDGLDTDATPVVSTASSPQDATTTTQVGDGVSTTEKEEDESIITTDISSTGATSTTEQDEADLDELQLELEDELLMMDNNRSSISPLDPSTTDVSDMDLDTLPTSETQPSDDPTIPSRVVDSTTEKIVPRTTVPPPVRLLVPVPTKPTLQIITPIRGNWDLGVRGGSAHLVAASHLIQQDRTTRATPETTTVAINVPRSTEQPMAALSIRNDSDEDKKNRAEIVRQEAKDALREANDASNRFVYHHLPPTEAIVTSTTETPDILQVRPLATTPTPGGNNNYLEQLRKINEIVAENQRHHQQQEQLLGGSSSTTRIRFPSNRDEEQLSGAASNNYPPSSAGSGVRFPGSATNRLTSNGNRLPDIFPKKSPNSTTQRPAFWWLPSGWEVDQTGNKPMLLRFWSRMPLVRDSSLQPAPSAGDGTTGPGNNEPTSSNNRWRSTNNFQHYPSAEGVASHPVATARGNSKSPSENFYKEVSAQEVYKVMNARQLNHHHQR